MTPVRQTKFRNIETRTYGNCLRAAVASLLDLSLEEVEPFEDHFDTNDWYQCFSDTWPGSRGLVCKSSGKAPPGYAIAFGDSPRGGTGHAAVVLNGELAHDPHPDGTGVLNPYRYYWFEKEKSDV
jgi:hypothetical protein